MSGGYVGVSVFFTLSGFLITTLALVEQDRHGRLDVGAFYARRLRRLMPASLLCLIGVSAAAWLGVFDGATSLRGDVWAALGQVYNWVVLAGGEGYADVMAGGAERTAPLDHYWSLAVEEQFYWVWPLVLVVVLRAGRVVRRLAVGGLVVAFALAAPVVAQVWGPDAAYWATPARLAEILVGAFAGLLVHERRQAAQPLPRRARLAAPAGVAVIAWAALTWPAGEGPAHKGWLPVFALASAAVIVGVQVDGPVRRLLSWRPLVALGAISYGVYLFHWPVYAVLDEARTGLARAPLFALRLAVTLVVATASYRLVECPVREARWTIRPVSRLAVAGCALMAAVVVVMPIDSTAYWAGSESDRQAVAIEAVDPAVTLGTLAGPASSAATSTSPTTSPSTSSPSTTTVRPSRSAGRATAPAGESTRPRSPAMTTSTTTAPTTAEPAPATTATVPAAVASLPADLTRPVRILVVGDSTASATGEGLVAWAAQHPDLAQVTIRWGPACGFIRVGTAEHEVPEFRDACDEMWAGFPKDIATLQPDVVMLMATVGDSEDRRLDDGTLLRPGESAFAWMIRAEYQRALDDLVAAGARRVLWAIPPAPDTVGHVLTASLASPQRWTTLRSAIEATVGANAGVATTVDVAAWVAAHNSGTRPDGLHLSTEAATVLANELLAPTLIALALS